MPVTHTPPRVGTTQIGTEPRRARRRPGRRWRAALLAVTMAAGVVALGAPTAQAGATPGTVPEVRLASDAAGELTISWDPPASTPSDYRVMWAEETQDYLSWKADNEATRGNSYPSGTATSLTLAGLTEGAEYKVRVRSRYRSGPNGPWSGPWTDEATLQVSSSAPTADPALGTRSDPQLFTPTQNRPAADHRATTRRPPIRRAIRQRPSPWCQTWALRCCRCGYFSYGRQGSMINRSPPGNSDTRYVLTR